MLNAARTTYGNSSRNETKSSTMPRPDLTLLFSEDVSDWDSYLSRHFEASTVHHEMVEDSIFPIPSCKTTVFSDARVVLVIISPQFLAFLESHQEECFQLAKLLKPGKTLAMLCGVTPDDVKYFHKSALLSYDDWRHLMISTDKDINNVRNVIETIQEMLTRSKENERITKPKFKLIPRKVQEGNGKVYVMLAKPVDNNAKIRICIGVSDMKEVPVKKRNPYTLMFVIPDNCMNLINLVNIHIWCGEDLLGVSQVKCESKMSELFSLLSSVNSPYEFLSNTLGVATLHDVDEYLTAAFRKNMPKSGFDLLQIESNYQRPKAKEDFPTLLHFASRHGLCQLVKELLQCPGAETAYLLKNVRGLTPAQLANYAGHNDVAATIDDYQIALHLKNKGHCAESAVTEAKSNSTKSSNLSDYYDIPSYPVPVPQSTFEELKAEKECEYLKMESYHKENIEPLQNRISDMTDKRDFLNDIQPLSPDKEASLPVSEKTKLSLLESQAKLIEIMEAYKKGASLTEVERLHNEWKALYQVSDIEAKSTLEGLRNLYAKAQKAKLSKKHSTSFSELRQFLNSKLRRKDSIGSKASLSRKNSNSTCIEKLAAECDANRPISTLSVLSNTSSSSGSSFDRLSTTSAGSDSGHHSDISEERNVKRKEKIESRYCQQPKSNWLTNNNIQKNFHNLPFCGKPPAPPPRPAKPISRYAGLGDSPTEFPQYSVARKSMTLPVNEIHKQVEYVLPDSNNYNGNDGCPKASLSRKDFSFLEDPNANYDCPPPPRPSCCPNLAMDKMSIRQRTYSGTQSRDAKLDYDLVPPPLPLSAPPKRIDTHADESYDVLNPTDHRCVRSNSFSLNYDFPRTTVSSENAGICPCHTKTLNNSLQDMHVSSKKSSLPSVPSFDLLPDIKNDTQNILKQYHNLCFKSPREENHDPRDSIPEEMAPPPPVEESESADDHYKIVGLPIPVHTSLIKSS